MPLGERIIQPCDLGVHVIPVERVTPTGCAESTLVGVLQQLASVVRHADDIFCDITEECQKVFDRSDNISRRLIAIENHVRNLDAKTVQIPVGDLSKFSRSDNHHTARHGFDCDVFTPDNRPQCIRDQYNIIDRTPSRILRGADLYRKDGLSSSRLFKLWPIVLHEHKVKTPDLNLPRKSQSVFTFDKRYKKLTEPVRSNHVIDGYLTEEKRDPSKEDAAEVCEYGVTEMEDVQVDVTGTGFHRMQSFRKALAAIEYEDVKAKKKQRRRTLSGVPENILREIELFEQKRKSTSGGDRVKDYRFEDTADPEEVEPQRDEEMAKYLDEIDAKIEERREDERFLKEPRIMKFFPCRRSKSLPRCVKLGGVRAALDKRSIAGDSNAPEGSCLTLSSLGSNGSRQSRSTRRSSIGNKIRALVRSASGNRLVEKTVKPRPKSLDLDALDFDDRNTRSNLAKMPSMPDCVLSRSNSTAGATKVGPGSYYNFESESNTLPRRHVKRPENIWEGLPKDWTTSVKLREITKRRSVCTDRQSSSGHWSGSNSNRHSLDSDNVKTSQYSLGQDSGRDSPIPDESRCGTESTGYNGDDASTLAGDTDSVHENKLDTESWLKSLAIRAAGRDEVTSSSAETLSSLTRLTKKNIMALDLMMSSPKKRPPVFDDGESSVYSVDQEGFYTSFHNDSGLKKSTATLVDNDDLSPSKDTHSVASMCSIESVIPNPDAEKFAGMKKGSSKLNKVMPPAPPPRTSSYSGSLSSSGDGGQNSDGSSGFTRQDSSVSDTDQETISNRVMSKTQISSTAIPSLCPLLSDEEMSTKGHFENVFSRENFKCEVVDMNQNLDKSVTPIVKEAEKGTLPGSRETDDNFEHSKTLPRRSISKGKGLSTFSSNTNSWPRSRDKKKKAESPTKSGILKSNESSLNEPKPPKSLIFSPVVNMFNPGAPCPVEMPLPSPSSSEDGGKNSGRKSISNMAGTDSYKLTMPLSPKTSGHEEEGLPMKYQPTIIVKPGNRSSSAERKGARVSLHPVDDPKVPSDKTGSMSTTSTTPGSSDNPTPYAISQIKGVRQTEVLPHASDGYMQMQNGENLIRQQFGSINSLESSESLTWSNSLTYVTMASPCSSPNLSNLDVPMLNTPTGSFESLNDRSSFSDESKFSKSTDPSSSFGISRDSTFTKSFSNTIDNSNLSSTMETVAITTNSFGSFNGNEFDLDAKSFQTFTGPIHPPKLSSTPYIPNDQNSYQRPNQSLNGNQNKGTPNSSYTPVRRTKPLKADHTVMNSANAQRNPAYRTTRSGSNLSNMQPKRGIPQSQSFPEAMSHTSSAKPRSRESRRTENYRPNRRSLPNDKTSGAVVNLQNMGSEDPNGDNSASSRSDSYRVAMVNPNNSRTGSYRVAMRESLSCPSFQQKVVQKPVQTSKKMQKSMSATRQPIQTPSASAYNQQVVNGVDPADFNRTDSYRVAVRSTQGVVPMDVAAARNSSYRVAVDVMEPVIPDSRMEGLMTGNSNSQTSGRDSRRMGITNVDQLKSVSSSQVDTSKIDTSSVVRRRPKPDVDPISEISNRDAQRASNRTGKNSSKRHSTSSTYIKFDPIFELGEDVGVSMESLKTGSNSSLKMTPDLPQTGYGFTYDKPKINAMNGAKLSSEKSASKLFGSIKSTIKSISGNNNTKPSREFEIEDDLRFSMV
ncbi:hypothetical protein FSP39_005483 [Pinctada imbricata]|uniref:WASP family protein member n=1 Tax=Pinctada imbricata TaxID=66713 RepID=A0AA88Y3A3_PINIB|nr:hypothetical protein FSP39_005483 [Pinctada imbricata]